jgi:hypothetical protein
MAMKWRRGLLLAGVNLVAALPLILMMESEDAQYLRDHSPGAKVVASVAISKEGEITNSEPAKTDTEQEGETVTLDPCEMWGVHYRVQYEVAHFGNIPAFTLTGWRILCPPSWTLSGRLHVGKGWAPTVATAAAQKKVDLALCVLIVIQWFLVGSFPLMQTKKWWTEPGMFITACTVIATCMELIPWVNDIARLPALIAALAWIWWLGLLIWQTVRFGWRWTTGLPAHRST